MIEKKEHCAKSSTPMNKIRPYMVLIKVLMGQAVQFSTGRSLQLSPIFDGVESLKSILKMQSLFC